MSDPIRRRMPRCGGIRPWRNGWACSGVTPPRPRRRPSPPAWACPTGAGPAAAHALGCGSARRVELARILFSDAQTLLLDEPTNHLDADSIAWLRDHLRAFRGAVVIVSRRLRRCWAVVGISSTSTPTRRARHRQRGWRAYLEQRETNARRRKREAASAQRQAAALQAQADKMRAKATKARAAQGMERRAQRLLAGVSAEFPTGEVARVRSRSPFRGEDAAQPRRTVEVVRVAGGLHRRRRGGGPGGPDRGARTQRGRQDHLAAPADRAGKPDTGGSRTTTGCASATTRRSTRRWTTSAPCSEHAVGRAGASDSELRASSGRSCSPRRGRPSPPPCCRAGRRPGSRWPCWWCRRPTCCARRADQQPGPGEQPDPDALRGTGARSCWSPTIEGRWRRCRRAGDAAADGVEDCWSEGLADRWPSPERPWRRSRS